MALRHLPSVHNSANGPGPTTSPGGSNLNTSQNLAASTTSLSSVTRVRSRNPYAAQPSQRPPSRVSPSTGMGSPIGQRTPLATTSFGLPGSAGGLQRRDSDRAGCGHDNDSDVHSADEEEEPNLPPAAVADPGAPCTRSPHPSTTPPHTAWRRAYNASMDANSFSRLSPGISFNVNADTNPLDSNDRAPFARYHSTPPTAFPIAPARSGDPSTLPAPSLLDTEPQDRSPAKAPSSGEPRSAGPSQEHTADDQPSSASPDGSRAGRAVGASSQADASGTQSVRSVATLGLRGITAESLEELLGGARVVDVACPAGFTLTVYSGDMSKHFLLPSENVQVTRGSIKYVDHHARYGAQTRFRFQLCHNYLLRKCPKLSECSYIHATQLPAPTQVHLNPFAPRRLAADRHGRSGEVPYAEVDDPAVANQYETMPPGATFTVFPPHGNQVTSQETTVPSELVIKTSGAEEAWSLMLNPQAAPPGYRPRHCAHFQFKRVCNLGRQCGMIHSKVPFAGTVVGLPSAPNGPTVGTTVIDAGRKPVPLEFEADQTGAVRPRPRTGTKAPRAAEGLNAPVLPMMNGQPQQYAAGAVAPQAAHHDPAQFHRPNGGHMMPNGVPPMAPQFNARGGAHPFNPQNGVAVQQAAPPHSRQHAQRGGDMPPGHYAPAGPGLHDRGVYGFGPHAQPQAPPQQAAPQHPHHHHPHHVNHHQLQQYPQYPAAPHFPPSGPGFAPAGAPPQAFAANGHPGIGGLAHAAGGAPHQHQHHVAYAQHPHHQHHQFPPGQGLR